jgi:general secretion pathway protein J
LVELLVAITLVALLSVLLFDGLRFATRSGDAVGRRVANAGQIALAYDFMTNELAGAQPLSGSDAVDAPVDFIGAPDAVDFVALLPADTATGGFFHLRAGLDRQRTGQRLAVSWVAWQRPGVAPITATGRPSVLLDGVRSIAFAYFGVQDPNQPLAWSDHWSERRRLPQLIRLRAVLVDGTRAPDLIVAPRLAGPPIP